MLTKFRNLFYFDFAEIKLEWLIFSCYFIGGIHLGIGLFTLFLEPHPWSIMLAIARLFGGLIIIFLGFKMNQIDKSQEKSSEMERDIKWYTFYSVLCMAGLVGIDALNMLSDELVTSSAKWIPIIMGCVMLLVMLYLLILSVFLFRQIRQDTRA